ncbi:MAG: type III restriction endonuclease, partial [Flammeovirgaceae bacterium]
MKKQTRAFVRTAITEFWEAYNGKRYEGCLPKIAFFASTIDELEKELRPAVEDVLIELNIPTNKILVNVGDDKITSNDDKREFINLDLPTSEKQFILLVNKGKEGWNCRSLFA